MVKQIDSWEGVFNYYFLVNFSTWMFVGKGHCTAVAVTWSVSCLVPVRDVRHSYLSVPALMRLLFLLIPLCPLSDRYPSLNDT